MAATPEIREFVEAFVAGLEDRIREAIRARFDAAIGDGAPRVAKPPARTSKASKAAKPLPVRGRRRKKGAKRTPAELAKIQTALLAIIAKTPGKRVEEINKVLGFSTAELAGPLAKLIAAKKVRRTGQKRATKYFPAGK